VEASLNDNMEDIKAQVHSADQEQMRSCADRKLQYSQLQHGNRNDGKVKSNSLFTGLDLKLVIQLSCTQCRNVDMVYLRR
jgi:ribosomal protein L44E